jgi:hypothetical protein
MEFLDSGPKIRIQYLPTTRKLWNSLERNIRNRFTTFNIYTVYLLWVGFRVGYLTRHWNLQLYSHAHMRAHACSTHVAGTQQDLDIYFTL